MVCPGLAVEQRRGKVEKQVMSVPNISCGHCLATIKRELGQLEGVLAVSGDAQRRRITVEWEPPATREQIRERIAEAGYPAAD